MKSFVEQGFFHEIRIWKQSA